MLFEEFLHRLVKGELVFLVVKAVAFVVFHHVFDFHPAFLQGRDEYFSCPAYPIETVVDPTGAGDTFAGGFVGALARMGRINDRNLRRAVVYGCVLASFTVEGFGVTGLLRASRAAILDRAEGIASMSRFDLSDTARILR